ncbi:MAG: S8 family serine peptidase [Planctomycetes bacterium]|nr:S8 family serine peptidase [Planctomycetota bacterium]
MSRVLVGLGAVALMAALVSVVDLPGTLSGQQAPAKAAAVRSSLDFGPAFDTAAQARFEQSLNEQDLARAVFLRSRTVLADPACPVPTDRPGRPFYVKFSRELDRELADRISATGCNLIGFARPQAHVLRAADARALARVQALLRAEPSVLGTVLQVREDRLSRGLVDRAVAPPVGDYRVLFWRDTPLESARALLVECGAIVIEATVDRDGQPDLDTPYLDVRLSAAGFAVLESSQWVENLSAAPWHVTTNQVSAAMSKADGATVGVSPYNLDGSDQIVGVWDSGPARDTHEQFQNAPATSLINNGTKRILRVDTTSNTNHGTHVTGTIIGDGTGNAAAKGFAPKAYVLSHDWNNIDQERRAAKHSWNHVADNHSYADFNGTSDDWGNYTAGTQQVDFTNRDFLLCQVQSAGNYASTQPGGTGTKPFSGGTCTVPSYNAHRNGFVIAAAQDNMDITGFSSRGPAIDGRLVPQFCANGEGLTSAIASGNTAYDSYSGTSMSGPSFCGGVALLSQLWRREHSDRILAPDEARSIVALTCMDRGNTGPDYIYGFGIIDVQAAADLILADKQSGGNRIVRGQVRHGDVVEYTIAVSSSTNPLRLCMSWLDIYANINAATTLVNDLDVELESPTGTIRYPYAGLLACVAGAQNHTFTTTGPNRRDNIELVHVDSPATGNWKVRVRGHSLPASPQTGFPNAVQGFVIASSHALNTQKLTFEDALNGGTPVAIPDNTASGVTRTFSVSDSRVITQVRVYTRIHHERRGDLRIVLEHPDGTQVVLKSVNSGDQNNYTDIIAVYPDTRQHNQDVTALIHKHVTGTWKVIISDNTAGNTGSIHYLALDMDLRVNNSPVADAGANFNVRETQNGQLNGSGSSDADGDSMTYLWTQTGGTPTITLSSATAVSPTFTAPVVSSDRQITFQLRVTDTSGDFTTDSVQFTILNNTAPVADAGADFEVRETQQGQLNAGGSVNAEGDTMTYAWSQTSGAITLTLSSPTAQAPTFTAPNVSQDQVVTFQLTVTDSFGDFTTDTVQVTVKNNQAPAASAGADFGVLEGDPAQLDATASADPESDTLSFAWSQVAGPTVTLSGATTATPGFTAPAVTANTVLTFEVVVTDSFGDSTSDTVNVTIEVNVSPVANAGADFAVAHGGLGALDGSASADPNTGDAITYLWAQVTGPAVVLSDPTASQPTFTAPATDVYLVFELTVTDLRGLSATDRVAVWVNTNGTVPAGSSGGGGKKKGGGGCSTTEQTGGYWPWLAVLVATLAWRRRREGA